VHGRELFANQIPCQIAKVQGLRATVYTVHESDTLGRLLAGEPSGAYTEISSARAALVVSVGDALRSLHWKDFETLVDLVFRQAGWRRRSVLGESMNYADLELEEPVTGDLYRVQIKARADVAAFEACVDQFASRAFRKLYFVVHPPTPSLTALAGRTGNVELVLPDPLAALVVDHGLTGWVR